MTQNEQNSGTLRDKAAADPRCPPGYRFLYQCLDAASVAEARRELCRVFGEAKGRAAKLAKGTRLPPAGPRGAFQRGDTWAWQETGFRAYLPLFYTEGATAWARRHGLCA